MKAASWRRNIQKELQTNMNSSLSWQIQLKVDQSESVEQHKAAVHIAGSEVRGPYVTLKPSSSQHTQHFML